MYSFGGGAIGIALKSNHRYTAGIWDPTTGTILSSTDGYAFANTVTNPIILIAKIVWGDVSNPTTIYQTAFTNGAALSEAAFNASPSLVSSSATFDPSTYTNLLLGGARFNVDELRVGSTFDDVIGVVPATDGPYWAPGAGGGGSGTWSSAATVWAALPNIQGTLPQRSGATLIFNSPAGTVTVNGTVTANAGVQFSVDGYSVVSGASTPQISLTGANAAANTITVGAGKATISAPVIGANGMTKSGTATLVLSGANTYGGGTVLTLGTLQITDANSLGSGSVDFEGGTLQYPPGTGAIALDISGKIPTVASGQAAKIDTDGYDVTFGTGIGGGGGLTKLGAGSLTLAGANTYSGPTTVSAGTLNVSSASGVIATLNVPAGGTVNLGAGAKVTALNVTGGTVNMTGVGAQVGTLLVSSGTLTNPSSYTLTITNSANLLGVALTLSGASSFTLNGLDLLNPTTTAHRTVTATGGTLTFLGAGLDAAMGIGNPGIPATAATTTFGGNGVWNMINAFASDNNNVYGKDNHAFHYIIVATGDFDIKCHVTGVTGGLAGLMARDNLVSAWTSHTGNYMGIWSQVVNPVQVCYSTLQTAVSQTTPPWVITTNLNPAGGAAWLELKRTGNLITSYYSPDGTPGSYVQAQQVDYTTSPWGPTTYLGLDLTSESSGGGSGAFDNVNFMGTAGSVDARTTDFALSGGALLNMGPTVYVSGVSTNGTALASGCWAGTAESGVNHVDPTVFSSTATGIAVIQAPSSTLTITPPADVTATAAPGGSAIVTFPDPTVSGGVLPIVSTNCSPTSGSAFPVGTNTVTCTVVDSTCPFDHTAYAYFKVIVKIAPPPAPVLDPSTGFVLSPGNYASFTFSTVAGYKYRLLSSDNVAAPLSAWQGVVISAPVSSDGDGWVVADTGAGTAPSMNLYDQSSQTGVAQRFYRIESAVP